MDPVSMLVNGINEGLPKQFSDVGKEWLRLAITGGHGLAWEKNSETNMICAILVPPLSAEASLLPWAVAFGKLTGKHQPRKVSTQSVVNMFYRCTRTVGTHTDVGETWVPAATHSLAPIPIGGDIGQPVKITKDETDPNNMYRWYDLGNMGYGHIVYRVKGDRTAYIARSQGDGKWTTVTLSKWLDITGLVESAKCR